MGFRISEGEFGIKLLAPIPCKEYYRLGILYIPKGVQVFKSDNGGLIKPHKRRAEKAIVVDIAAVWPLTCNDLGMACSCRFVNGLRRAESLYVTEFGGNRLVYRQGEVVEPAEAYCMEPYECDSGIHYYKTPEDLCNSYLGDIVLHGMPNLDVELIDQEGKKIGKAIQDWFDGVTAFYDSLVNHEED